VLAVGPGVTNFHPGDRVAYYFNLGGYASERVIPADKLVKLPDHITYEQGAVLMLKGLTVWYLLHKTFKVEPGHRVLIHAAAGGIGLLACQWAKALGAHVIGHRLLQPPVRRSAIALMTASTSCCSNHSWTTSSMGFRGFGTWE
jgi:NADPH2:quinone reductase